jgi:hypothetical protein
MGFFKKLKKIQPFKKPLEAALLTNPATGLAYSAIDDKIKQMQQKPENLNLDTNALRDKAMLELEGERQEIELMQQAARNKDTRKNRRDELAKILSQQADQDFRLSVPGIAEDANAAGLYTGTGYSEALARERANLAGRNSMALQLAATGDAEAEVAEINAAKGKRLGLQEAGVSRVLSLDDYTRNAMLANSIYGKQQGGGKGGTATGALSGAASGASTGATIGGPKGAAVGAGLGAVAGAGGGK